MSKRVTSTGSVFPLSLSLIIHSIRSLQLTAPLSQHKSSVLYITVKTRYLENIKLSPAKKGRPLFKLCDSALFS